MVPENFLAILDVSREPPDLCRNTQENPTNFLRDSRELPRNAPGDSHRDSASEKTPFVMTPFSGPEIRNEKSAQRGSFWDGHPADNWGSFARISRPKTSVRAVEIEILEKKQAFGRGYRWPEGADVDDPKGFPKTSVRKTLGWISFPVKSREKVGVRRLLNVGQKIQGCCAFWPTSDLLWGDAQNLLLPTFELL